MRSLAQFSWIGALAIFVFASAAFAKDSSFEGQIKCARNLSAASSRNTADTTVPVLRELERFAEQHNLPMKWLPMGPPDRKIDRLFVGIDTTNKELVKEYLALFNLDRPLGDGNAGTIALEFSTEKPTGNTGANDYVFGILRTDGKPEDGYWRSGMKQGSWEAFWKSVTERPEVPAGQPVPQNYYDMYSAKNGLEWFGHLIGLSEAEAQNLRHYLANPALRGPIKSGNCVAWLSSLELGKTAQGCSIEERIPILNALGVSRAMAHFEIGRRFMHAANDRHRAIIVGYRGEEGRKSFDNLENLLPPKPNIAYTSIIKGYAGPGAALDAVRAIPDGAKIFFPLAAGASSEAMAALAELSPTLQKGFDAHVLVNGIGEATLRDAATRAPGKIRLHALFLGGNARKLYSDGLINVIPGYLGDFNKWVGDPAHPEFDYDAMVVRVSPPVNGIYSLGPNQDMIMSIIRARPNIKIIAEVNPNVPFTVGGNQLRADQITAQFPSTSNLAGPASVPLTDVETAIGRNLATLVPNGATLQVGIGNIFDYFPQGLKEQGRSNINIFTEMFSSAQMEMIKMGIVNSARATFAFGSAEMYKWLANNQKVRFEDTETINNPGAISQFPNFCAINTALQVNLRGEANATHGPEGRMSSPGGQVEFMDGASKSKGGKAILAIRSTAKNGTLSTIVMDLYGPVTTPAEMVGYVVTEYGIAQLQGKNEAERAMALIRIAHPKFRAQLVEEALAKKLIKGSQAVALRKELAI